MAARKITKKTPKGSQSEADRLAAVARASSGRPMILGTIKVAKMPIMAITTIISIKVKPASLEANFALTGLNWRLVLIE